MNRVFKNDGDKINSIMKLKSIECTWSGSLPDLFTREIVIRFPDPSEPGDHGTVARGMMQIDGTPGDLVKSGVNDIVDGKSLLKFIRSTYMYRDACRARFAGETLVPGSFRFLREFALVVDADEDLEITIESTVPEPGSIDLLDKLMDGKTPLIDNVCLRVPIPPSTDAGDFKSTMTRITDALTSCIVATREDRLRTVSISMEFDASSSMEMFDFCVNAIESVCMEDDMYDGMKGIALNSFMIALIPLVPGKKMSSMISDAVERLNDKLFDARQVKVIPIHVINRG